MSDEVFDIVTKSGTPLSLNGLISLSKKQANSLVKNHKDYISLNGIITVCDEVVEILSRLKGFLYLEGLVDLNQSAAEQFIKFQGKSLSLSKRIRNVFNKSVFIATDKNKDLQICLIRKNSSFDWVYLYAVGYSGGGVHSESFFKYKKEGSDYFIYKKSSIVEEPWDEYYKNEENILNLELVLSTEDKNHLSDILGYVGREWLVYESQVNLNDKNKKLINKNIFGSPYWDEGGI